MKIIVLIFLLFSSFSIFAQLRINHTQDPTGEAKKSVARSYENKNHTERENKNGIPQSRNSFPRVNLTQDPTGEAKKSVARSYENSNLKCKPIKDDRITCNGVTYIEYSKLQEIKEKLDDVISSDGSCVNQSSRNSIKKILNDLNSLQRSKKNTIAY